MSLGSCPEVDMLQRVREDWQNLDAETLRAAEELERGQPDPLAPLGEQIDYMSKAARLAGRRDVLERLGYLATE